MTPAIMGLTLAGMSEISTRFRPSVAHHIGRFAVLLVGIAFVAASVAGSGSIVG